MDETVSYHFASVKQRRQNRHEIEYQLTLRQQPKQSRMCGVGEKADRRPIDPPPIVQLKVIDNKLPPSERNTYLQNPYYFMYASLMAADLDEELHLLKDGKTRSTTGSVVSSLYHLKDIDNTDAGFFVFPDLSVRMEGSYRLKLSLFEIIGKDVFHCRSIISNKFFVYSAKKFPGMEESTFLSRSFADQGLKIRIRKELRQRRKLNRITADSEDNYLNDPDATGKRPKTVIDDNSIPTTPTAPSAAAASTQIRLDVLPNPAKYINYNPRPQQQQQIWAAANTHQQTQRFYHPQPEPRSMGINDSKPMITDRRHSQVAQLVQPPPPQQPQTSQPTQQPYPSSIPTSTPSAPSSHAKVAFNTPNTSHHQSSNNHLLYSYSNYSPSSSLSSLPPISSSAAPSSSSYQQNALTLSTRTPALPHLPATIQRQQQLQQQQQQYQREY
ncbi:velvet factor-domain-containing protein [Mycotypha africana]|uniref:velvet factor-domain-containing protein n=1 Tax=Mycotypha africana TaxID=64632 RepID=UPI002300407E|nr:velvet factor-domain-containing protein [Mycotypha africana]KAI8969090.1 velvet factor-domain-containing protein [Mycotypha africana]